MKLPPGIPCLQLAVLASSLTMSLGYGAEPPALEVHGALSTTAGYSDAYNYLGRTDGRWDLFSSEVTVNGAHRFANGARFSAQVYAYQLDDYRDLVVDFCQLDRSFNEALGIRIGRGKQAVGLYGDTQDIDMVRPLALLPLNSYPKAMRAYGTAYDGAAAYGSIVLGEGSLDYHVYGGLNARYSAKDPWLAVMNDAAPLRVTAVDDAGRVFAGSLYWNTPLAGLRFGATISRTVAADLVGIARSTADLAFAAGDIRLLPNRLPPGLWEGAVAGRPGTMHMNAVTRYVWSAEYSWRDWVFSSEYMAQQIDTESTLPVLGTGAFLNRSDSWYVMATWHPLPRWEFAAYYEEGYANTHDRDGRSYLATPRHRAFTKTASVAACYRLADWWLLKAQVHRIDGTALLTGRENPAIARWTADWNYVVVKTTISF